MSTAPARCAPGGTGSVRERSPGVWEILVVVGFDMVHGRSVQRSFTVRGDVAVAEVRRAGLRCSFGARSTRGVGCGAADGGELLDAFVPAPQSWRPATRFSLRTLCVRLPVTVCSRTVSRLRPRWRLSLRLVGGKRWGRPSLQCSARWLALRSGVLMAGAGTPAVGEPLLLGLDGQARPAPRLHLSLAEVRRLLSTVERRASEVRARCWFGRRFVADQILSAPSGLGR